MQVPCPLERGVMLLNKLDLLSTLKPIPMSVAHPVSPPNIAVAEQIAEGARWLAGARKTVALTGAGVSTESGIPDFRSAGGLWSRYDPQEYATLTAFLRNPGKVWAMLAELGEVLQAEPNPGHRALAKLEANGGLAGIITQNIDGLHQAAGSRNVIEYHGNNRSFTCLTCRTHHEAAAVRAMPKMSGTVMPRPEPCPAGTPQRCLLKPDVIFFDEEISQTVLRESAALVSGADLMLVIGTSCEVYPAALLPEQVREHGGRVIEINLEPAEGLDPDLLLQGRFGEIVPRLVEAWERLGS
jgi:NAD-dependent deacetylase